MSEKALARLRREAAGFAFRAFHLMEELTAVENVELPALLDGASPRAARRRALNLLERTGMSDRARFLTSALSGGQRQRVPVAPALANGPLVVSANEPTGNLDSEAAPEVLRLFDGLRSAGQTLVIVSHDSLIAARHDVVAHGLAVVVSLANGATPEQSRKALESISELGRQALADTRGLLSVLRAEESIAARAPQPGIEQIADLVDHAASTGLAATLTVRGDPVPVAAGPALVAYRIVQESDHQHD